MNTLAKREALVLIILIAIFVVLLIPSLQHARRETRDGLRRHEIADIKHQIEMYFNEHESYPLKYDASPHEYVTTETNDDVATGWYLRARLENEHKTGSDFDHEPGRQYYYRYVNSNDHTYFEVCGGIAKCN